jgi:hypothetical protein
MNSIFDLIKSQIRAAVGQRVLVAAVFLAAIVIALLAVLFMLMAAQGGLIQWYHSQIKADLTLAGALAFISAAVAIAGAVVQRKPAAEMRSPLPLALAIPVAAKIAPKLINRKFLGVASMILGAVLIGREIRKR